MWIANYWTSRHSGAVGMGSPCLAEQGWSLAWLWQPGSTAGSSMGELGCSLYVKVLLTVPKVAVNDRDIPWF